MAQTEEYEWMAQFLKELVKRRKVALRRGEELETQNGYNLRHKALKKLCAGSITVQDLTERDFYLDITQKGWI